MCGINIGSICNIAVYCLISSCNGGLTLVGTTSPDSSFFRSCTLFGDYLKYVLASYSSARRVLNSTFQSSINSSYNCHNASGPLLASIKICNIETHTGKFNVAEKRKVAEESHAYALGELAKLTNLPHSTVSSMALLLIQIATNSTPWGILALFAFDFVCILNPWFTVCGLPPINVSNETFIFQLLWTCTWCSTDNGAFFALLVNTDVGIFGIWRGNKRN